MTDVTHKFHERSRDGREVTSAIERPIAVGQYALMVTLAGETFPLKHDASGRYCYWGPQGRDIIPINHPHPLDQTAPTPEQQPTQPIVSPQERASMIWIRFRELMDADETRARVPDTMYAHVREMMMERAVGDVDALIAAIEEGDRTK